jgi:hypothetical protein
MDDMYFLQLYLSRDNINTVTKTLLRANKYGVWKRNVGGKAEETKPLI